MLICRLLIRNAAGCSYLVELSKNTHSSVKPKSLLTSLANSSNDYVLNWPKMKSLLPSGTKDQGNSYALMLLIT